MAKKFLKKITVGNKICYKPLNLIQVKDDSGMCSDKCYFYHKHIGICLQVKCEYNYFVEKK